MTDRINALTVVLDRDYRDDDVECIVNAIKMVKGVQSVTMNVSDYTDLVAQERALEVLRHKLREVLWPSLAKTTGERT